MGPIEGPSASSITTFHHPSLPAPALFARLEKAGITCSLRYDREGRTYLRFSPHFYNTEAELDEAMELLN
jgi:selenocysteine lyase/cysteine desulfurase